MEILVGAGFPWNGAAVWREFREVADMNGMTLTIKGLFGHFNYEIPLYGLESVDGIPMSDGVTILTGANGYGKSTILRALEAISKGDIEFFANLKFEELALHTEEGKEELSIQNRIIG